MPVLEVNSEGVSFAMSFICGLSTMATLIEPPFVPDAGVPPLLDDLVLLLEPPHPVATSPTTASTSAADLKPKVRLISLSSSSEGGQAIPPQCETYNVGLCWLSSPIGKRSHVMPRLPC